MQTGQLTNTLPLAFNRQSKISTQVCVNNYYRFPIKNNEKVECWESFVKQENILKEPWRAKRDSHICSDHFQLSDYIIPPLSNGTCRLKIYAIPSRSIQNPIQCTTPPDELQSRLEHLNKRPLPPTNHDEMLPPEKVRRTAPAEERDELIRNLQQQLRCTKQKANTMDEVIKTLQEKLVISSKEAEALHSTFKNTHLEFLYNFKENLKSKPCGRRYSDEIKEFALTLYFYSTKAYKYVCSIIPLPNPSLIRISLHDSNASQVSLKKHSNLYHSKLHVLQLIRIAAWLSMQCPSTSKPSGILKKTSTLDLVILVMKFLLLSQRN